MFNTIDDVYSWLYVQKKLNKREDLSRISRAAKELDVIPTYKLIHIAGTNGKGSVAEDIKAILSSANYHAGFFVSPYILKFNERIQINDRMISDAEIMHYANILKKYADDYFAKYNDCIPFFELTLLMALMYFKDRRVDVAIIECGLGGRLDSTNFLKCDLAIISSIGYDHMAQLGNSLAEIAAHKLGIVWDNMKCFTCADLSLKPQFDEYAKAHNASIEFLNDNVSDIMVNDVTCFKYKNKEYKTKLLGSYQAYNAALAIEAVNYLYPNITDELIRYALLDLFWPGRLEIISNNPLIILDGAHNISAIEALTATIKNVTKDKKLNIIFTALADKAYDKMLTILDNICNKYYFTSINDTRKTDAAVFDNLTNKPHLDFSSYEECIDYAIKELKPDEALLITGSLHFISMARAYIKK